VSIAIFLTHCMLTKHDFAAASYHELKCKSLAFLCNLNCARPTKKNTGISRHMWIRNKKRYEGVGCIVVFIKWNSFFFFYIQMERLLNTNT
jgi:hypothetical protein